MARRVIGFPQTPLVPEGCWSCGEPALWDDECRPMGDEQSELWDRSSAQATRCGPSAHLGRTLHDAPMAQGQAKPPAPNYDMAMCS
ncbi:MAG: hypothetical protein ABEL04_11105 [Salinibacter sp.]